MPPLAAFDLAKTSVEPGREAAFVVLLAFLGSFLFIRTSTRMIRAQVKWWPGNVETAGGTHVHHMVIGIFLLIVSGFTAFATNLDAPWWQITSIAFGIGAGLTLDEFALWLHLEDVYWKEEGRQSLDAVVLAALAGGLVVVGVNPLDFQDPGSVIGTLVGISIGIGLAVITFLKGRILLGVAAVFLMPVGIYCASRLAMPDSPWARWRYTGRREHKLARARKRFAPDRSGARLERRFGDLVAGAPTAPDAPPPAPPPPA